MKIENVDEIIERCFALAEKEIDDAFGPCQGTGTDDCPCLACNPPDAASC